MRQAERALRAVGSDWPDVFKNGVPRSTFRNTVIALDRLELNFAFDMFRSRKSVQGRPIQEYQGDLSDDQCAVLRRVIIEKFNFDPGKENTRDAALTLGVENPFHPIRQYLDALHWDRTPRVDVWPTTYLGAEPTPLNKAIGRIVLLAGVRRIRRPGSKFDTIMVLEGPQGGGKSTAIKMLAGPENFSDQELLTLDAKAQMEALEGVWILEIAELEGISRADTAKVKAFASRSDDNARPAYARFKEKRPRQTIFIGTTNDDKYLRDMTGNRRFWPVKIGQIDLEALARDRDQLWAEAAHLEAEGESLTLPQELWPAAQEEQEARLEDDPWLDKLSHLSTGLVEEVNGFQRISTAMLLGDVLSLPVERQQAFQTKRLANLMRKLGWQGPILQKMKNGQAHRGYQRPVNQTDTSAGGSIDCNF
jgi:predicted P-loop ATPase